ncbi:MAG: (d)CMP kinase [Legionellales bacterium]|nr:(d)CMP kinase [Legionellales bacterium]
MGFSIPVITIDGPSGTGKGTIGQMLAEHLGWHRLDSGVLYRAVGLAAKQQSIAFDDEQALATLAQHLDIRFSGDTIFLAGQDVSLALRHQDISVLASKVAALPLVREALTLRQRHFRQLPGLVTDGRDMGTVIFPDATLKFYLDASADVRALRRYKQLKAKKVSVKLGSLLAAIKERDERDRNRSVAPLRPAEDAILIDTSDLDIKEVFNIVLSETDKILTASQNEQGRA